MFQRDMSVIQERFESILGHAVTEVKTKEDPFVLNKYKKLFKQNVPLSLRSYVAAYIVKQLASGVPLLRGKTKPSGRDSRFERGARGYAARIVIDQDSATTIFFGVGRNRGVFPRDLIALLCQKVSLERERIGEIRVLDNYSFVQVYADDAEKIIRTLNGSEYRNRKLTVSRSRKKEDDSFSCNDEADTDNYEEPAQKSAASFDSNSGVRSKAL